MGKTLWSIKSTPIGCSRDGTLVDTPEIHTLWWRLGEKLLLFARAVWSLWGVQPSTWGRHAWYSTQNFAMLAFNIVFFLHVRRFRCFLFWHIWPFWLEKRMRKHEDVTYVSVLHWTFFSHWTQGKKTNHSTWNMWRCKLRKMNAAYRTGGCGWMSFSELVTPIPMFMEEVWKDCLVFLLEC